MMKTSVVVCSYTLARLGFVETLVDRLRSQSLPVDEILLVVDPEPAVIEGYHAKLGNLVTLLVSPKKGASAARNHGLMHARAEIVAFIDDDAYPDVNWNRDVVAAFGAEPSTLAVGGYIEAAWHARRPLWFPPEFDWIVGSTYRGHPTGPVEVRGLATANMACRTHELRGIGGFSESIGRVGRTLLSGEDIDACIRLKRAHPKGKILFIPGARVHHQVPPSRARVSYFIERAYYGGLAIRHIYALHGRSQLQSTESSYLKRVFVTSGDEGALEKVTRGGMKLAGIAAVGAGYVVGTMKFKSSRGGR